MSVCSFTQSFMYHWLEMISFVVVVFFFFCISGVMELKQETLVQSCVWLNRFAAQIHSSKSVIYS